MNIDPAQMLVIQQVRSIVETLRAIDPLYLEVVIQSREDVQKSLLAEPGADQDAANRYGVAVTKVITIVQKFREEILAARPDEKDGPAAAARALAILGKPEVPK